MSGWDDLSDVTEPSIPAEAAEAVLSGDASAASSPEVAELGALFTAARRPADEAELDALRSTVSMFQREVVAPGQPMTARNPPVTHKLTRKAAVAVGAAVLVSAGAVAAAGGGLSSPFGSHGSQSARVATRVDETVDSSSTTEVTSTEVTTTVETTVPESTAPETSAPESTGVTTPRVEVSGAVGPDADGPAKFGLCTAWAARQHGDDSEPAGTSVTESSSVPVPFANLEAAAAANSQKVEEFCADSTPGGTTAADDAATSASRGQGQSDDNPSATAPGRGTDNPSVTAPGRGTDNPSVTAPGLGTDNPSVTAPGHSGSLPPPAQDAASEHRPDNG